MHSSYPTRTKAQPMDLRTLVKLPLKNPFMPSSFIIFAQQSMVPLNGNNNSCMNSSFHSTIKLQMFTHLYIFSFSPLIIMSLLRTVSKG